MLDRVIEVDQNDELYKEYLSQQFLHNNKLTKYLGEIKLKKTWKRRILQLKVHLGVVFLRKRPVSTKILTKLLK